MKEGALDFDYERILALSPNPYVILDPQLVIVWMNDAYLAVTMRSRSDLIGRKMFDAFPSAPESESHRLLEASLDRVLQTHEVDELALIRYDIASPDGGTEVRYWSATHIPLKHEGRLAYIMQHTVDVTELEELRQVRDEMGLVRRARAVQEENLNLKQESRRLLDYFDQAPGFLAVLAGRKHRFEMVNQAYSELVGRADLIGQHVEDVLPEIAAQGFIEILDEVYLSGKPYFGRRAQVSLGSQDATSKVDRFLNFIFQPIFDNSGDVVGIIVQGNDVTEEVEAQERQNLLVNELNHRVKNTLAIVQALATQTFRSVDVREDLLTYESRLLTLASAHSLLTEGGWGEANVQEIVARSAEATLGSDAHRVHSQGPEMRFDPQTAVALAMVIHELCTNALKYGALSTDAGRVHVTWQIVGGSPSVFNLEWKEAGGPSVSEPARKGFGTRLIGRGISERATGATEIHFEPDGLRCTISKLLENGS